MSAIRCKRLPRVLVVLVLLSSITAFGQGTDLAWTFGNVGFSSYRLDAISPGGAGLPSLGSQDPTLPLDLGGRYQVKVTSYAVHPFEVIAKGSSASQDTVLLSMSVSGPFESDPDVAWQDDGKGTVRFTLTTRLYQAMVEGGRVPGYRCRPHASLMRGDFTVASLPIAERIEPSLVRVDLETVASGLASPVVLVPDPAGSQRLYVVDQAGVVRVIDDGQLLDAPFLNVRDRLVQPLGIIGTFDVNDFDERGLLGLAFHPGFVDSNSPGHGRLYTYTSEPATKPADFTIDLPVEAVNHQSVVTEWQVAAEGADVEPNSARVLMRIDQPQFNHNAGHLAFGPDGYLYIALGDGGGANDTDPGHGPEGNGQNVNTAHGSILRIDPLVPDLTEGSEDAVSANDAYRIPSDNPFVGADGVDEIYAYGLRNPYRFSFDPPTGRLIAADVGQGHVEEIDIVENGGNYGWNIKEGDFLFDPDGVLVGLPFANPALIDPVAQYDHDDGLSIIGGHVYHGAGVPELSGLYVFGDFSRGFTTPDGRLLAADLLTGEIQELLIGPTDRPLGLFVKGIGQDNAGEIYLLASTALGPYGDTGVVLKIVPAEQSPASEIRGRLH
jgi:glucose/arabinose dehydrogenase